MHITQYTQTELEQLKAELFLQPSNELIANRFSNDNGDDIHAGCSGRCQTGMCKPIV